MEKNICKNIIIDKKYNFFLQMANYGTQFAYPVCMKRILAIFILLSFFCFGIAVNIRAEDSTIVPNAQELRLLELINAARKAPLDKAASLDMDTEKILRDLPELNEILTQGMKPLVFNPQLYAAAKAHNKDMLTKNYYSHTSPDGRNNKDRISEIGYRAVISGESLGLVGFVNYMAADEAVRIIFENMFREELNPARTENRNILNPDFRDIGIGFSSGTMTVGSSVRNVYVAVCEYARHETDPETVKSEIVAKINECRKHSDQIIGLAGQSSLYGEMSDEVPESNFPSLSLNNLLMEAASNHSADMAGNLFFDNLSSDGKKPLERIDGLGYNAVYFSEIIGLLASDKFMEPEQIADVFIRKMIENEAAGYSSVTGYRYMLRESVKDMGIGLHILHLDSGNDRIMEIYLLVLDFAADTGVFGGGCTVNYDKFVIWDAGDES